MSIDPGLLKHRVTIRRPGATVSDGGFGATEGDPVVVASGVWARVRPLKGSERLRAMQTQADATHEVTIRYRAGLDETMEVVHRERVLKLVSPPINVEEENETLLLLCREET